MQSMEYGSTIETMNGHIAYMNTRIAKTTDLRTTKLIKQSLANNE